MERFAAEVHAVRRIGPNLVRVVLGGGDLPGYPALDVPDESVAVYLPTADGEIGRNYTVRAFDPATARLTIDFVLHDGGVLAQWAARAEPGQRIELTPPRSWYRPPAGTRWQLLAADLTGLPALARILEGCDGRMRTHAVVEVLDERDLDALPQVGASAGVALDVVVGGNGVSASALADRVCGTRVSGDAGYVWFAGEAGESRRIRKQVRGGWGWGRERLDAIGYWRLDAERWAARYARVEQQVLSVYGDALAAGRSEKEASELYDDALERAGL